MPSVNCPICAASVDVGNYISHIEESHSDLSKRTANNVSEADYLKDYFSRLQVEDDEQAVEQQTALPSMSALEELGIKIDDVATADVTTETGATLTSAEAKRVLTAVETFVEFRIDRASFIVNFIDWGIRNSFTEELTDAGGFTVISHNTVAHKEQYFKISTLHNAINESFNNANTGRTFTFRRMGRYLAKSMPTIIEKNEKLSKFYVDGSPMSNRFGVPPADFLAVTSIFEYVKPYNKWSASERMAWQAHNRSITKLSNQANEDFLPTDLRPAPSRAARLIENHQDDFSRRHGSYGKGETMFEKMISGASTPKNDKTGLGYYEASQS